MELKKRTPTPFLKCLYLLKFGLLGGFLILFGILIPFNAVLGVENVPFVDDFDSYIPFEPLDGQGGWSAWGDVIVEQGDFCVDYQCAKSRAGGIEKTGSPVMNGGWVWFFKMGSIDRDTSIYPFEVRTYSSNGRLAFKIFYYNWIEKPEFIGKILLSNGADLNNYQVLIDNPEPNKWYKIFCEWQGNNEIYRCRYDDYPYSDWLSFYNNDVFDVSKIVFDLYLENDGVDEIGGIPECSLENCGLCETYDACISAGCYWLFSNYLQEWYCATPTGISETCGSFYNCQFCLTMEECEGQLNCVWEDRGQGEKCYMEEVFLEIPAWQVPELEDCSTLSGTEKWLCDIKNFFAGLFMPSQEKVNRIYNDLQAFKLKFPFNYIGILKGFFRDIEQSLETSKTIPVKLLGNEKNVDFSFFNTITTIGGETETFKNVWYDFSSIFILIGFVGWLISFVKRIF